MRGFRVTNLVATTLALTACASSHVTSTTGGGSPTGTVDQFVTSTTSTTPSSPSSTTSSASTPDGSEIVELSDAGVTLALPTDWHVVPSDESDLQNYVEFMGVIEDEPSLWPPSFLLLDLLVTASPGETTDSPGDGVAVTWLPYDPLVDGDLRHWALGLSENVTLSDVTVADTEARRISVTVQGSVAIEIFRIAKEPYIYEIAFRRGSSAPIEDLVNMVVESVTFSESGPTASFACGAVFDILELYQSLVGDLALEALSAIDHWRTTEDSSVAVDLLLIQDWIDEYPVVLRRVEIPWGSAEDSQGQFSDSVVVISDAIIEASRHIRLADGGAVDTDYDNIASAYNELQQLDFSNSSTCPRSGV